MPPADSPHLARMGRVYDFIQDHLNEDLSVERLADVAILSPWHFQRVFREFSGEPAAAFVRRLRVERAADRLLVQKSSTVDAVARECGYGSGELLARHFQQRFHVSPSAWRSATPAERDHTIRQTNAINGTGDDALRQNELEADDYYRDQGPEGNLSDLHLERRPERRLIYTRHFQGYDHEHGIFAAFERLHQWAQPRGLLGPNTIAIAIGLDNPRISSPERCRLLCCFPVANKPELGGNIGYKVLPAGQYAWADYRGRWDQLSSAFSWLYQTLLPQAGVEAIEDLDYLEYPSAHPSSFVDEPYFCRLVLRVRTL